MYSSNSTTVAACTRRFWFSVAGIPQSCEDNVLRILLPCSLDFLCEVVLGLDTAFEALSSVRFRPADSLKVVSLLLLRNEYPCPRVLEFWSPTTGFMIRGCQAVKQHQLRFKRMRFRDQYAAWCTLMPRQAIELALPCCLDLLFSRHTRIHVRVPWSLGRLKGDNRGGQCARVQDRNMTLGNLASVILTSDFTRETTCCSWHFAFSRRIHDRIPHSAPTPTRWGPKLVLPSCQGSHSTSCNLDSLIIYVSRVHSGPAHAETGQKLCTVHTGRSGTVSSEAHTPDPLPRWYSGRATYPLHEAEDRVWIVCDIQPLWSIEIRTSTHSIISALAGHVKASRLSPGLHSV